MRVNVILASAAFASGQLNTNAGGIEKVQSLLEDFKSKLNSEGKQAAKLYEDAACTFKTASEEIKSRISSNQATHEETEGTRQESESIFKHLNGPKTLEDSVKHSKNQLALLQAKHSALVNEKNEKNKEAMRTISQAEEAILLIESAEAALQSTTEKVNSLQAFIQLKAKLRSLSTLRLPQQEQPKAHRTSHSTVLNMLDTLKNDVGKHLEQVRGEWTVEENRLVKLIQEKEAEIAITQTKIKDDTLTMEEERANVLAADQKMHGLQLEIESDTKLLKEMTERADRTKKEYEADNQTRLQELQAVASALRVLIEKFAAAPTAKSPLNDEGGSASPIACVLSPADAVVAIPTAFIQMKQNQMRVSQQNFLQSRMIPNQNADNGYDVALNTLQASKLNGKSIMLTSVMSALRKKDPMKKIRVMIKNLIQRLKDEATSEQNRNEYCTTEETAKQEARASHKKSIKKYETGLEKAQEQIAECRANIKELETAVAELKQSCSEQNGQLQYDIHNHNEAVNVANHGKSALQDVMVEMGKFFSDASQSKVESGYSGNTNAAQGINGIMQALIDDFQKTIDVSTEESQRLNTEASDLVTSTSNEVADKREQERQIVETELTPALTSYKANGSGLHQTVQEYSLLTEELIVLKYDSDACRDTQLSKEEEAANKEAEIQALKDALDVLENHGNN